MAAGHRVHHPPRGYVGDLVVEGFHDPIFKEEREWAGQLHALEYLKWCRGNPHFET